MTTSQPSEKPRHDPTNTNCAQDIFYGPCDCWKTPASKPSGGDLKEKLNKRFWDFEGEHHDGQQTVIWDSENEQVAIVEDLEDFITALVASERLAERLAVQKECAGEVERIREELAEIEHDQWIAWSKNVYETENLNRERIERWKLLWRPYSELTEAQKDQDREWADKVLSLIERVMPKKSPLAKELAKRDAPIDSLEKLLTDLGTPWN